MAFDQGLAKRVINDIKWYISVHCTQNNGCYIVSRVLFIHHEVKMTDRIVWFERLWVPKQLTSFKMDSGYFVLRTLWYQLPIDQWYTFVIETNSKKLTVKHLLLWRSSRFLCMYRFCLKAFFRIYKRIFFQEHLVWIKSAPKIMSAKWTCSQIK